MSRPLVAIESPFAGDVEKNVAFARTVCRYAVRQGFSPLAIHLQYPQFLDDNIPEERALGIECGLSWTDHADRVWFCLREEEEMTPGMLLALDRALASGRPYEVLRFTQEGRRVDGFYDVGCGDCGRAIPRSERLVPRLRNEEEVESGMEPSYGIVCQTCFDAYRATCAPA